MRTLRLLGSVCGAALRLARFPFLIIARKRMCSI